MGWLLQIYLKMMKNSKKIFQKALVNVFPDFVC